MRKYFLILLSAIVGMLAPIQMSYGWGRFPGGVHPGHDPHFRHDPVVVHNVYVEHRGGGCIGCGVGAAAVAGLVTGAIVGAAIAGSAAPPPTEVIVAAPPPPPYGTQIAALPPGCAVMNVNGVTYYQCAQYWYQPYMGGNGVYYTLVPAP